jgi:hypothetical protein
LTIKIIFVSVEALHYVQAWAERYDEKQP